ncbi:calcium/sodium antiporter [Elusimicrobiota bacterium]
MIFTLILLIIGFAALYYGAEWLIKGACAIGLRFKLSKSFVGLTLVALGTSAPEFVVNTLAAFRGHTGLALSNVAGSNLTNLCIGFGLIALVSTVAIKRRVFAMDLGFFCLAPILVSALFLISPDRELPYWSLILFAAALGVYLWSLKRRSRNLDADDAAIGTGLKSFGIFLLGITVLYLGGEMVLRAALGIAKALNLSEALIGLTIVAIGTSIPDVVASVIAAKRGEQEIAVGNLIGSNISNIFFVLGGTILAAGRSLQSSGLNVLDFLVLSVFSLVFFGTVAATERTSRLTGITLLALYLVFILFRVQKGLSL